MQQYVLWIVTICIVDSPPKMRNNSSFSVSTTLNYNIMLIIRYNNAMWEYLWVLIMPHVWCYQNNNIHDSEAENTELW